MRLLVFNLILGLALIGLTGACSTDGDDDGNTTLTVTATIEPDPPITGQNTLHIRVVDSEGAGVAGATVSVDPQMPMMGHGSPETAVVTDLGAGDYDAFPVTFSMPGHWEVTIDAAATEDSVTSTGEVMIPYDLP